jgi:hypothetical protein
MLPFTRAFVRMMFAHAEFERRVSDLMGVVTGDPSFGERPENMFTATSRPKRMKKLIKEHEIKHISGLPEIKEIASCLTRAIEPSKARNMLAHGHWWAFDPDNTTMTVRAGLIWPDECLHRDFSEGDILEITDQLDGLEVELYLLQRKISARSTAECEA